MLNRIRPGGPFKKASFIGGAASTIGSFVTTPQQINVRALAGAAVFFTGSLFNASTNSAQASQRTYGTHELAIKQAAQVSRVWSSVRTPPVTATALPTFVYTRPNDPLAALPSIWTPQPALQGYAVRSFVAAPQIDVTQKSSLWPSATTTIAASTNGLPFVLVTPQSITPTQSLIWKSADQPAANRLFTFTATASQPDPTQPKHQLWGSVRTPPVSGPLGAWFRAQPQIDQTPIQSQLWMPIPTQQGWINLNVFAAPQDDPTVIRAQFFKSADTTVTASAARLLPLVQTAPQFNPIQIQSQLWASQLSISYAVETWITSVPQANPTQVQPQVFGSVRTPPAVIGPTVTQFVLGGQTDYNLPTVFVWTPSTFSAGNPIVIPDTSQKPAGRKRRRYEVEIDGQIFEVSSVQEAQDLLTKAKYLARQRAPIVASAIVEQRLDSKAPEGKPIRVPVPQISTPDNELANIVIAARHAIAKIYREQALVAEIRIRLELAQLDEDDDEILILL